MNELLAVQIRGWAISAAPEELAAKVLGAATVCREVSCGARWRMEDPVQFDEPVGPVRSLVVLSGPSEIDMAPGSMGLGQPGADAGHAIVHVRLQPREAVVLDARCWYRADREGARACVFVRGRDG